MIQFALVPHGEGEAEALADSVHFFDAEQSLTAEAEMSFAKWEPPASGA